MGTIEGTWPASGEDAAVEQQPEPPDNPSDEETTPSPFPADSGEHDEPVASAVPGNDDNVSIVPAVGSASTATSDTAPVEDGAPPLFADDPNVIRVAGGNNSSQRGAGRRDRTPAEEARLNIFEVHREALRKLEPKNPALTSLSPPGWVPNRDAVAQIHRELIEARARAAGGPRDIPGGTAAPPGGGRLERPLGIPRDWRMVQSDKGGGTTYINPNNEHDRVRVMPGNPDSPYPNQQRPYVIDRNWGR